jgi:manganese transport protein
VESVPAVIITFFLTANLLTGILNLMLVFVFVLIGPAVTMGMIASNERVMGDRASRGLWRVCYWTSLTFVVALGILSIITQLT